MKTSSSHTTAAAILQTALERLKTRHRRISLRSLAARLKLSPSYLSKIFRGERPLPLKLVAPLAKALQLDHHEVLELQRLALSAVEERELKESTGIRALAGSKSPLVAEYKTLGSTDFWLLEEWFHLPILNLATTEAFDGSPTWVARRMGISPAQAKASLDRLLESGHLRKDAKGRIERTRRKLRFPTQRSHPAVRAYHRAMIRKAFEELSGEPGEQGFARRLFSGVAFAGDPARIEEAKILLEEAMYRAAELLAGGNCSEVFQVNLQMFGLTQPLHE